MLNMFIINALSAMGFGALPTHSYFTFALMSFFAAETF